MAIVTQTSRGSTIPNQQNHDAFGNENALLEHWRNKYDAVVRGGASGMYNCHGLTFAARRTCVDDLRAIAKILADDNYREVPALNVLPGDIVLYYEGGVVCHSGIVVEVSGTVPRFTKVVSKWGPSGEFVHWVHKSEYGQEYKYYRVDYSQIAGVVASVLLIE